MKPEPSRPDEPQWAAWPDEKLLDLRICDLDLKIEGTSFDECVRKLYAELEAKGIVFRPHFWISDEWFTPDGVPGIAAPFYLFHPRLARLEFNQMFEVEGGTPDWCARILRHETGHAIDNAYRFRRKQKRRELFGKSSKPYPDYYTPKPYSKSFVKHLDRWYAQSHPDEDFAETFAVWLDPDSQWKERYAGWPALKKLEYIDALMRQIAGKQALVTSTERIDALPELKQTLREHYREKRKRYGLDLAENSYDEDLKRLFSAAAEFSRNMTAARFLNRIRKEVRRVVATQTGAYQYTVDQVLEQMIQRCRELKLRLADSEEKTKLDFTVLLTVQTVNYLRDGGYRVAL
ncbi:MAG TPA: putative zinc-binding metallopeptidase [Candidatus Acidoferrales bacterium]|nr:putative zinc-binding metallopeptidase [Candidatus Acidoferrales bacterium]